MTYLSKVLKVDLVNFLSIGLDPGLYKRLSLKKPPFQYLITITRYLKVNEKNITDKIFMD